MEQIRITILLIAAIILQWTAGNLWQPLIHIDFVLIAVVYSALQRNAIKAVLFGTIGGVAIDALSGGILGSNGFTKTLIAFLVSEIARRFNMDNAPMRLALLASACVIDDLVYFGVNSVLGQVPSSPFLLTMTYNFIGTFIVGLAVFILVDNLSSRFGPRGESFTGANKKTMGLR